MNTSHFGNEYGFSLIEVMIALTVFAIGLLAVATLQITSVHGNSLANQMTIASNLAQAEVATLEATVTPSTLTVLTPPSAVPAGKFDADGNVGTFFTRTYTVDSAPTTASRWVTVTVSWSSPVSHQVVYKVLMR